MTAAGQTIRGARLTLIVGAGAALLQVAAIALLARLISPSEYGLMIAALALLRPVTHALMSGFERAVVLPGVSAAETTPTLLQAAAVGGAALAAVIVGAALAFGALWGGEDVALVLAATAPTIPPVAVYAVARGALRRDGRYGRLGSLDVAGLAAGGGAAVAAAALLDWGAYALVAGQWAQALVQLWLGLRLSGLRLAPYSSPAALQALAPLRCGLSKSAMLDLLLGQIPSVMIWLTQGVAALGLFNRMYVLIYWPLESLVNPTARVSLDSLSRWREDPGQFRHAAIRLLEATGAVALPLCGGMALAGPELSAVILGPQWTDGGAFVPWLCLAGGAAALTQPLISIAEAGLRLEARARAQTQTALLAIAVLVVSLPFGVIWGLAALCGVAGTSFVLHLDMAAVALALPRRALLAPLAPGLAVAAACVGWGALWRWMAPADALAFWRLAGMVAGCAAVSFTVYRLLFPNLFDKFLRYAGLGRSSA